FAVGGRPRRNRTSLHADDAPFAAGRQVALDDRVDGAVRILVVLERLPRRDVATVIEVLAVGGNRRLARILLKAVLLGDLQAVGPVRVVHPDLAGTERSGGDEVPPGEDVAAVGRPRRTVDPPAALLRD